jgi:N6-adenosine-specific RNA methylase IME4
MDVPALLLRSAAGVSVNYQVMPPLSADEYEELKADILARGVLVPVEYDEHNNILDGHHRVQICNELGITEWPRVVRIGLSEAGKLTHARQLNLARRHLDREQKRELIAQQLRETPQTSDRQIAESLGVSPTTVGTVRSELEEGGELSKLDSRISADGRERPSTQPERPTAYRYIDDSPEGRKAVKESAKVVRAEETQQRREERIERIAAMANPTPMLPVLRFPVIYADPPWRYEFAESESRAIENQYPTMSLDEIRALDVAGMSTDDAILFMWATSPKLAEAMSVVEAWGFTYRSSAVWVKPQLGMGYYFRQQHELLLVATRGDMPAPAPADRPRSVVTADRLEHSAKPAEFAEAIERMYPTLPKIELFCRSPRDGWAVWGNQSAA